MKNASKRTLVALAAALSVGFAATSALAGTTHYNPTITNSTGAVADDFHIEFASTSPITVSATFTCGSGCGADVAFNNSLTTITNNGTTDVVVNYSGAQVAVGQSTHAGADLTSNANIDIVDSFWTSGGVKITNSPGLPTFHCTGGGTNWITDETEVFPDNTFTDSAIVARQWTECQGTGGTHTNPRHGCNAPIFIEAAQNTPGAEIPLSSLNGVTTPLAPSPSSHTTLPCTTNAPATGPIGTAMVAILLVLVSVYLIKRRALTTG